MDKKMTVTNHCLFCGKEFHWGEMKTLHVIQEHPSKIPVKLYEPIVLWYLNLEETK